MREFDLLALLFSFVGRTFIKDGREVKVLSLLAGPIERYYVCVWTDTCMVYCAPLFEVAESFPAEDALGFGNKKALE